MLPDLAILVALVAGLFTLVEAPVDPVTSLLGTLASLCVAAAMTWMGGERGVKAAATERIDGALSAIRWVGLWPLVGWLGAIAFFQWGELVATTVPRIFWLTRYVVLFLPATLLFAVGWIQRGRIEAALASRRGAVVTPAFGAREALKSGLRRNGIALLPMVAIVGLFEALWVLGELGVPGFAAGVRWLEAMPFLSLGLMLVVLTAASLFLPALFRRVLKCTSMPQGRLRDLLEHQAAMLGLRYRDIVVWNTAGRVINAMVVGFTPRTRLVFLTDGLLRRLPEEELLAVFSHEAGHARRYHLPLFLLLFVTTAILFQVAGDILEGMGVHPGWIVAGHLGFLWFVLLGSVSRLFEREADVYGALHAADLDPQAEEVLVPSLPAPLPAGAAYMIRALERIRLLSGRGSSHRHGTIEDRVHYLAEYATQPQVRKAFDARRRGLWIVAGASALLAVAAVAWRMPGELRLGRAKMAAMAAVEDYTEALDARARGDAQGARRRWQQAYDGFIGVAQSLEDDPDPRARGLVLETRFNAADTALHGLEDEPLAQKGFQDLLARLDKSDFPRPATQDLRFQSHVDLGRILAHEGDPGAWAQWTRARTGLPASSPGAEAWFRARLRLLRGVLLARAQAFVQRAGALDPLGIVRPRLLARLERSPGSARALLEGLAARSEEGLEWDELRRDARLELDRFAALGLP